MPQLRQLAGRWEEHMKGMVMPSTYFEELGFNYIGPIDGHDIDAVVATLKNMKQMPGPRLLHLVTQKGHGFEPAEHAPTTYHGVTPFDRATGALHKSKAAKSKAGKSYTQIFGDWLCDTAAQDSRLLGITPAMREGSGLVEFAKRYPERYFDVGIAEQHAVTLAAGMACEGMKPVVAIYSTFLQRAYDQLVHDVCLQGLDVTLAVDRAGLVGADGATHAGSFDLSYARPLPNLVIAAPADENECRQLLQTAYQHPGPALVRYPRGTGPGVAIDKQTKPLPIGKGELRRQGQDIALLAFGSRVAAAEQVGERLGLTVANMRFIKPLDELLILQLADRHRLLVTIEENAIAGGAGSAVSELLAEHGINVHCLHLGLPDTCQEQAEHGEQLAACGLDAAASRRACGRRWNRRYRASGYRIIQRPDADCLGSLPRHSPKPCQCRRQRPLRRQRSAKSTICESNARVRVAAIHPHQAPSSAALTVNNSRPPEISVGAIPETGPLRPARRPAQASSAASISTSSRIRSMIRPLRNSGSNSDSIALIRFDEVQRHVRGMRKRSMCWTTGERKRSRDRLS
jgi:1-deoxy-D-xylulose-5-phosphate synthase